MVVCKTRGAALGSFRSFLQLCIPMSLSPVASESVKIRIIKKTLIHPQPGSIARGTLVWLQQDLCQQQADRTGPGCSPDVQRLHT